MNENYFKEVKVKEKEKEDDAVDLCSSEWSSTHASLTSSFCTEVEEEHEEHLKIDAIDLSNSNTSSFILHESPSSLSSRSNYDKDEPVAAEFIDMSGDVDEGACRNLVAAFEKNVQVQH